MSDTDKSLIRDYLADSLAGLKALGDMGSDITAAAGQVTSCLARGGTVYACGNGGSAADAQHFVAELVGRFETQRPGLRAVALTVGTSVLTALGNDFGFDEVFSRQISALGREGDLLIGISTSGQSANVLKALNEAQSTGLDTLMLSSEGAADWGGPILRVPARRTALVQQLHITVLHMLCLAVDASR